MSLLDQYLLKGAEELGISLSETNKDQFALFAAELCKWNSKVNLTAIIKPEEIAIKHFIDSLELAKYVEISGGLLDIGSGGGFPCLPLKIVYPALDMVSIDAVAKKIHFQRHIARLLGLSGIRFLHGRVEDLSQEYQGAFKCIVSRAFAALPEFVGFALPLLSDAGVIVAMKGGEGKQEAAAAAGELDRMGVAVSAVHEFVLPLLPSARSLILIRKL